MTEGIGRTTLGRVSSMGARPSAPAREVGEEPVAVRLSDPVTAETGLAEDLETRHRLRRALRILLAARRRDDGAHWHHGT
jgi:hypothetical protein